MWVVFGGKTKAKRIPDGREVELECPECKKITPWAECEVKDEFNTFFAKVPATNQRRMVCVECGDSIELDEVPHPLNQPPRKKSTEFERDALLAALKEKMRRGEK